ncbi:unnamed protein product, partial [Porites evermanni]
RTDDSRKVQVTILASEWGSSKGGLSTINRELAIQLAKCPQVEITFFLPQCSQEDKKVAMKHNIKIVEATPLPGFDQLNWLCFPPEHLQMDIIIGHGVKLGKQAQIIKRSKRCKWVQVVHTDPEELGMFKNYSDPISKGEEKHKMEVKLCEMADHVVGVGPKLSEAFRSYLRSCQKDDNLVDFTPGVFVEFTTVKQAPSERQQRSVLVFGRGDVEDFKLKGFDIAGKAIAELEDTRLVFVGAPDGKHEEIAKRLTGCGVPASRLRVRGFVEDRESLRRLFQEVDLVVMPSRTEGFGLTGLEALSAGLPVLVSCNSGFGKALHSVPFGSTFVVNSEEPADWASAIKTILVKDRRSRLEEAETLCESYGKKYNWAKQIKDLIDTIISWVATSRRAQFIKYHPFSPQGVFLGSCKKKYIIQVPWLVLFLYNKMSIKNNLKSPFHNPGEEPRRDLKLDEIFTNLIIYEGRVKYNFSGDRMKQLQEYHKANENLRPTLEILGFSTEQVNNYVEKFTKEADKAETIKQHITSNLNLVAFCYVPVNCFIICSCLLELLGNAGFTSLPTRLTEIYSIAVRMFYFSYDDDQYRHNKTEGQQYFLKPFKELPSSVQNSNGLFHRLPDFRDRPLAEGRAQYCFLHLTLQEFLAAKYLVDTLSSEQLRGFVSDHIKDGAWKVVMQFFLRLFYQSILDHKSWVNFNLLRLNWSCFEHTVACTNITMLCRFKAVCLCKIIEKSVMGESLADDSRKVQVTILASEWGSSKGGLSTINRELAIQFARWPEVKITFFLPQCSQEDKKVAMKHNVKIVEATPLPGFEQLDWLCSPPEDLQIDIIVGHGVKLGKQAQIIKRSKRCKWVQVVHTDPEELGMFKNYSDPISKGEEKHKTEVKLCEMADHVVAVGPKLSEAFRSYLRSCQKDDNLVDFTPGVFEEFATVKQAPTEGQQRSVLVFGRGDVEDFKLKGFDIAGKAVAELEDTRLVF